MKKTLVPIGVFIISTGIFTYLLLGDYLQKSSSQVPEITVRTDTVDDGCPAGYDAYASKVWRFCYPYEMELASDDGNEVQTDALRLVFTSPTQILTIGKNQEETLPPINLCNVEESVTVSSASATRRLFTKETVAGCGGIYRIQTVIVGADDTYLIDLKRLQGTIEDLDHFIAIEKSFHIP